MCFPLFVSKSLAQSAAPLETMVRGGEAVEEPFDSKRFHSRALICKHLSVLQRQVELTLQRLQPAFEDLYLSSADEISLKVGAIKTPDVAKRLVDHPLSLMLTQREIEKEEAEEEEEAEDGAAQEEQKREQGASCGLEMTAPVQKYFSTAASEARGIARIDPVGQVATSPAVLLATHHLLINNSQLFLFDPLKHNQTQTFSVRPLAERKALTQVKTWVQSSLDGMSRGIRDEADPIFSFAAKAKRVMKVRQDQSKAASAHTPGVPRTIEMTNSNPAGPAWTMDDLIIIQALRATAGHPFRMGGTNPISALTFYIAKECGLGNRLPTIAKGQTSDQSSDLLNQMPQQTSLDVLMKLGFVAPWENVPNMDMELRQLIEQDATVDQQMAAVARGADRDEAIRSDFDLPVYVIDEVTALELDDGVSVEATSIKNQYWVHVSVADPTTLLDINDPTARQAERRHRSIYSPDSHWSMLPDVISQQCGLRLTDKSKGEASANALQFSALVDVEDGKVKDINVKLVKVRDLRVMSYDQVDAVLTGSTSPRDQRVETDLKLLHEIAIRLEKRRRDVGGALIAPGSAARISLEPLPLPLSPIWQVTEGHAPSTPIFTGFPHIRHRLSSEEDSGLGPRITLSHGLVSELMILANRTAGQWISQRKVPMLFRSQQAPKKIEDREKLQNLRNDEGVITYQQLLQSGVKFNPGVSTIEPSEHFSLGVNTALALRSKDNDALTTSGYARVTSPLRRYPDLLNHWQIKHCLRKGFDAAPLVGHQELLNLIPRQDRMDSWAKATERNAGRYYFALKLLRGIQSRKGQMLLSPEEEKEVNVILDGTHEALVSVGEVRVSQTLEGKVRVQLTGLGAPAELKWDPLHTSSPPVGTKLQVKISDVLVAGQTGFIIVEQI